MVFQSAFQIRKMYQAWKGRYLSEARIIRFVKGLGTRIRHDVMTDTTESFETLRDDINIGIR